MIQRIQTIYLLAAAVLLTLCFFFPGAIITTHMGQIDTFTFLGVTKILTGKLLNDILGFVSGLTVALIVGAIFFYKRRKRQMSLCFIVIVLQIIITILAFIQIGTLKNMQGTLVSYKFPLVFPLISAVFTYLAYRGIKKDEELVKSYDRLR